MTAAEFLQASFLQAERCLLFDERCGECHLCIYRGAA